MLSLLCFLVVCGGAFAQPVANQYMDNVIHSTLQNVVKTEKLDPTFLPEFTHDYKDKFFFTNVKGKAEYSDGKLTGFSQVVRLGDCQGPTNISGSTVINCTLSFMQLQTSYKGKVKYGKLPKVSIDAKGNTSNTIISVGIAKAFNDAQARIKSWNLQSIRPLDAHFSGLGPLNKQMKVLEDFYKIRVTSEVISVINNRFRYGFEMAVGQVPMPLR